jgi:uncharacterized coiled-coil protein SlyX
MTYTLTTAAKATGKSRSTVLRAIRAGRISAKRDEVTGGWVIEPSELHRLYEAVAADGDRGPGHDMPRNNGVDAEVRELRARLEATEMRLADKDDVITDLRQQRDQAQQQLAAAQERIAALLTDQRAAVPAVPPAPARRSWWPWRRAQSSA